MIFHKLYHLVFVVSLILIQKHVLAHNTEWKSVEGKRVMVATTHRAASSAAYDILQQGGNATDALVTAQLVLNVVEPQSSGIGGGAFTLYWDNQNKRLTSIDGRETAPLSATERYF